MKKMICAAFLFCTGLLVGITALLYLPAPWDAWIGYFLAVFTVCFLCYPKKKREKIKSESVLFPGPLMISAEAG